VRLGEDCEVPELSAERLERKGKGLSFALRTAREYFTPSATGNITLALVSYYYGTFWLLAALWIADPTTDTELATIERVSKSGHGLGNLDDTDAKTPPDRLLIYLKKGGFFRELLRGMGCEAGALEAPLKWPNSVADLGGRFWRLSDVLARVPELLRAWDDVMERPPKHVAMGIRLEGLSYIIRVRPEASSRHFDAPQGASCFAVTPFSPGSDRDFTEVTDRREPQGCQFETENKAVFDQLPLHSSVWCNTSYVRPLADGIDSPIYYHFLALYALSIVVRYKPLTWRELLEGKDGLYRRLFAEYAMIAERVVPNLFLDRLTLRRHIFATHAYFS